MRNNDITTAEENRSHLSVRDSIPLSGDAHQHLIAGAQDFLDHTLGEVSPKMLTYLERKLCELNADLAVLRSQYIT